MKNNFFIKNLDTYIDVQKLEACHLEICAGLARSETNISSRVMPHFEMQNEIEKLIAFKNNEDSRIYNVATADVNESLSDEERKYFLKLNFEQRKKFLQLYKKAYTDGEFVKLRFTKPEFDTHKFSTFDAAMTTEHANAQFFPETMAFINNLPFAEIGRILFFVSYHYLHGDVHYDRKDHCFDGKNHFLWLNPFNNKSFFLFDENNQKQFIESKAAFFNTRFLHGALPSNHMTYSLRIDGQFTKEFCDQAELLWSKR